MKDDLTPNHNKNDESVNTPEESDYKNLINRLKEIGSTIAVLEKKYLDKF